MELDMIEKLKQFYVFSDFTKQDLQEMKPYVYWRTYKKGQLLFVEDDPRERIYFLLDGYVKFTRENKQGDLIYFDFIKQFTTFPYRGMFTDSTYHFTAEAVTDIELYYMPTRVFEEIIKVKQDRLIKIINKLSEILETHENRIQTIQSAQQRVLQTLSFLMFDIGEKEGSIVNINCPITTTDISLLAGTSRETVSQVFKQLKHEHIISTENKKITVYDPEHFKKIAL